MNFSNPNALWLLSLLVLPILIHLFQFRRYKKLKFSSISFLKAIDQEQKSSRKLKHLLILLSRLLFLFFLVLALARPYFRGDASAKALNLIVVDRSPSNLGIKEGTTRSILEEHMTFINALHEQFPNTFRVTDEKGTAVIPYEELKVNYSSTGIDLNMIKEQLPGASQILLLSDFQRQVIDDNSKFFTDTAHSFILMPPFSDAPQNTALDSLYLSSQGGIQSESELVMDWLSVHTDGTVNITLSNNEQFLGSQEIEAKTNGKNTIRFPINQVNEINRLLIQSNDPLLPFDNHFYASMPKPTPAKVLLLAETHTEALTAVFEDNELFELSKAKLGNYAFQQMESQDLVIVELGEKLTDFARGALTTYAKKGGPLVIFPKADFAHSGFLSELGLDVQQVEQPQNRPAIALEKPDYNHPFFSNIFKGTERKMTMPEAKQFLSWQGGESLLSFLTGQAFLSHFGVDRNLYLFNTPIDRSFTNFTQHGIFLPVLYKIALQRNDENSIDYFYLDQSVITLSASNFQTSTANPLLKLKREDQELIPDQRLTGNEIALILPTENLQPGFYDVIDAKTDSVLGPIALNIPRKESLTGFYTVNEIEELLGEKPSVTILDDYGIDSLSSHISESKNGFPLWKYFLIVALLSLLAEVLIIRLFK